MQTIVLVTGGFDPLHSGHLECFRAARELGDQLIIGLNSDAWLERKKGRAFMPWNERALVIGNLKMVDAVCAFDDRDGTARDLIHQTRLSQPQCRIIFANGGDRDQSHTPESDVSDPELEFRFGIGGDHKKNSSSWILEEWKAPKTRRPWGYYRVLHEETGIKVKELTVDPGAGLSMQRHRDRAEFWLVSSGTASVYTLDRSTDTDLIGVYHRHQYIHISTDQWHQLVNNEPDPLRVIEIQYGTACREDDIQRHAS